MKYEKKNEKLVLRNHDCDDGNLSGEEKSGTILVKVRNQQCW